MKLLDKYILRSYLFPFLCCMLAFSMLFVIWDLFDNLSKFLTAQTPPRLIATYYACLLLPSLEYIAPASSLLGTLYALWNFTRANELTAMRACGVSLYRIMVPFILAGFIISLAASIVKETATPPALTWIAEFEADRRPDANRSRMLSLAYYSALSHRQWIADAFDPNEPTKLFNVKVTLERADGIRELTYASPQAEWLDGRWWLQNPTRQRYDQRDIPIGKPEAVSTSPGAMIELPELTETPEDFILDISPWEEHTTLQMWSYLQRNPHLDRPDRLAREFTMHQRLALPWACFVVTIFGIPAGARTGRQNALTGIFAALGFFFAFYLLSHVGLVLGKSGTLQPWLGAWLANMVFLALGLGMITRMR